MMPARLAPSVCQAKRASCGPCCRSLGHTRNTYGLIPDRSGLDADGEIIAVGVAPPAYTRAAASEVPELRCPTTATIAGSAYSCSATRTAVSSFPESSTIRSSTVRPRIPRLALIWFTANWAARSIEAPRGWEKGPARPMAIDPVGGEHAASARATTRAGVRRGPPGRRGARLSSPVGKRNISPPPPTGFPRGFPDRCGQFWIACAPVRSSLMRVETSGRLYRFAGALEGLLAAPDAEACERARVMPDVDRRERAAVRGARRSERGAH